MSGHTWLWAVVLASILIFQVGSFGNTISPSATSEVESQANDSSLNVSSSSDSNSSLDRNTSSELDEQKIQFQGSLDCLLAEKPDCSPTVDETSEFQWGDVSIHIVVPDNPHPQSSESWTVEEFEQIKGLFKLNTIKQGNVLESNNDVSGPKIQSVPCDLDQDSAANAVYQFLKDSFFQKYMPGLGGAKLLLTSCTVDEGISETKVEITAILELLNGQLKVHKIVLIFSAEIIKIPTSVGVAEPIQYASTGCPAPNTIAFFDKGGAVGCTDVHPPPLANETQPDPSLSLPSQVGPSSIWINAVMNEIESGKYFHQDANNFVEQIRNFANDVRERDGTDWAVVVFVVDGSNDPDGLFGDGATAWSQIGGPYIVLSNRLGAYGFDNKDGIFLHEFLHSFYALDEYQGSFDDKEIAGYLGIRNLNHEDFSGGPYTGNMSIMKRIQDFRPNVNFMIEDPSPNEIQESDRREDPPGSGNTVCQSLRHEISIGSGIRSTFGFASNLLCSGAPIPARIFDESTNPPLRSSYVWVNCCFLGTPHKYWQLNILINENAHYRWGTYYWNEFGNNAAIAFEFLDKQGNPMAGTYREKPIPNLTTWQFQSVEFDTPQNAGQVVIYPTRCLNSVCKVAADRNYVLTGDWVFRHEIDQFAAHMLGFRDVDGDSLIDIVDTFPAIKMEQFAPRITLTLDENFFSSNVYDCLFETPKGSGNIYVDFGFETNQDAQVVDRRGPCRQVVDIDLVGRDPVVTIGLERCIDNPPGACGRFDEPPPPASIDIQASDNFGELDDAVNIQLAQPGQPFLLVQAEEGSTPINGTAVSVFPSDPNGNSGGLTPFKMFYATDYRMGDPIPGYAFDVPQRNLNPFGSHNSVTINKIIQTQYCRDEGKPTCDNWVDTHASDGFFDEAGEDFVFTPAVRPGINTIFVRANNTVGNLSGEDPFPLTPTVKAIVLNVSTVGPPECGGKVFASVITGTSQNDVLLGTSAADLILGFEGNDEIRGKGSADCLLGGDGNDIIYGNRGADTILGGEADDTLLGGRGNDKLDGGDDFDTCKGGAGTNTKKNCEA